MASTDEDSTEETMSSDTMLKVVESSVRLPTSEARGLYENIKIAIEGKPIPDDFVALSPLDCTPPIK